MVCSTSMSRPLTLDTPFLDLGGECASNRLRRAAWHKICPQLFQLGRNSLNKQHWPDLPEDTQRAILAVVRKATLEVGD